MTDLPRYATNPSSTYLWAHRNGIARTLNARWGSGNRPITALVMTKLPIRRLAMYATGWKFPKVTNRTMVSPFRWIWELAGD